MTDISSYFALFQNNDFMKKIVILAVVALVGSLTLFSCSKGDKTTTSPTANTMVGTVNGKPWNAPCFAKMGENYYGYSYISIISGDTALYPYIGISIPLNTDLVGSILINDSVVMYPGIMSPKYAQGEIDSSSTQYAKIIYGAITITQKTPTIVGSFHCTFKDSTKFTASFNCKAP
jgi:hypothetical protein